MVYLTIVGIRETFGAAGILKAAKLTIVILIRDKKNKINTLKMSINLLSFIKARNLDLQKIKVEKLMKTGP